jgi:hypothetical protein
MQGDRVQIVSPVGALEQERLPAVGGFTTLDGLTLGVIQLNGAAPEFVDRIVERLTSDFKLTGIIRHMKDVDMAPSPPEVLADMQTRADLVISAYGH